jgi:hypothetical protein
MAHDIRPRKFIKFLAPCLSNGALSSVKFMVQSISSLLFWVLYGGDDKLTVVCVGGAKQESNASNRQTTQG